MHSCPHCQSAYLGVCFTCGYDPEVALYRRARAMSRGDRLRKFCRRLARSVASIASLARFPLP